jgi:hypothetical protein
MTQKSPLIEEDCGRVDSGMRKVPVMENAEKARKRRRIQSRKDDQKMLMMIIGNN